MLMTLYFFHSELNNHWNPRLIREKLETISNLPIIFRKKKEFGGKTIDQKLNSTNGVVKLLLILKLTKDMKY